MIVYPGVFRDPGAAAAAVTVTLTNIEILDKLSEPPLCIPDPLSCIWHVLTLFYVLFVIVYFASATCSKPERVETLSYCCMSNRMEE